MKNRTFIQTRDENGQAIVLLTIVLVVLMGFSALVADVGYAYYVKRSMQASADAAALAGAQDLPNATQAVTSAKQYTGEAAAKNAADNVPGVSATVTTKCVSIAPCNPVNAIVVDQSTTVSTKFARVLGINTFSVHVRAIACSPCAARPLDVMLVLDRTGSMCTDSQGTQDNACTDLENARAGLLTFLGYMDPTLDRVGLAVLPPAASLGAKCNSPSKTDYREYDNSGSPYVIVPLSTDYKTNSSGPLNTSSDLVSTINCVKGAGGTAYATALEKAQAELNLHGRPDIQDVIVFLSDGAANYGPSYYAATSAYRKQPCHQGINSAAAIKATGTVVYSIGYDLNATAAGTNTCAESPNVRPEVPSITAYSALQAIATNASTFYNKPNAGQLNTIYASIAGDISGTRLLDNNT
jgi:Flp pilus assembly protein TadG